MNSREWFEALIDHRLEQRNRSDTFAERLTGTGRGADLGGGAGKIRLPSPPTFTGIRGSGKPTVDVWLMQFLDWCELAGISSDKRVQCAVQCLEGQAVSDWYNLRRQLSAEGADACSWDTFHGAMIKQYADVSPDISVRNRLFALRQGSGTVQSYYDSFRAILSLAVKYPVTGADAIWFFKQGLSDRVRTAIAVYGENDLDDVVLNAKRVDAAFGASVSASATASTPIERGSARANAGLAKRASGPSSSTGGDPKRAKIGTWDSVLADLRKKEEKCAKCGGLAKSHTGIMGRNCEVVSGQLPPTSEERQTLAKGKHRA